MKRLAVAIACLLALPALAQPRKVGDGARKVGTGAVPTATNGATLYGLGTSWAALAAGTDGKVLTLSGGLPSWQAPGGLSGGGAGRLGIWLDETTMTSNAATMADPTTGVVTLGPPLSDETMLTVRASILGESPSAHIMQWQAGDNSPLGHIAHDGSVVMPGLQVTGGTPGIGKVLTDDGTGAGIATWQAAAASDTPGGTGTELQYRAGASTLGGAAGTAVTPATGAIVLTAQAVGTTPLTIAGTSGQTAPVLSFGPAAAAPINVTIAGQDGSGTNVAGQTVTHRPGLGTGTGGSGSLILQAAPVDATGTGANTPQAVATFAAGATTITTTTPTAVAATTAGNSVTIAASNATAGLSSAGAAVGGNVMITAGNAARYTSGNANGGNIYLTPGSKIGTGSPGRIFTSGGTFDNGHGGFAFSNDVNARVGMTMAPASAGSGMVVVVGNSGSYGISSANYAGIGAALMSDTSWRRKAAANPAWGVTAASPVAYTHTLSGESRGGTDTDVQGAAAILQPGNGTGTGGSGTLKAQTAYPDATGTTANTYSDREVFAPKWTTLTESSATAIATLTFGASSVVGAEFLVTIESNDGTDYQALTSRVRVSSVRKAAGNTVSTVALVGTDLLAESTGTSTLTATYTLTEGASAVTLNVNAVSSLTQTILRATFQAVSNGPACTIAQS